MIKLIVAPLIFSRKILEPVEQFETFSAKLFSTLIIRLSLAKC